MNKIKWFIPVWGMVDSIEKMNSFVQDRKDYGIQSINVWEILKYFLIFIIEMFYTFTTIVSLFTFIIYKTLIVKEWNVETTLSIAAVFIVLIFILTSVLAIKAVISDIRKN